MEPYNPIPDIVESFLQSFQRMKTFKDTPTGDKAKKEAEHLWAELQKYLTE